MRAKDDPLKATNVRERARDVSMKRWAYVYGDRTGEIYREGFEQGYELGVAYALDRLAKGKSAV